MNSLINQYNEINQTLSTYNKEINDYRAKIKELSDVNNSDIPTRIEHLEKQLKKIDDYELRIGEFALLAKRHIKSTNLATIEAPKGYRVNINRLKQWSLLIDPLSQDDDPYAMKVYLVSQCDLHFLALKKKEFNDKIAALKAEYEQGNNEDIEALNKQIDAVTNEISVFCKSNQIVDFMHGVKHANKEEIFDCTQSRFYPRSEAPQAFAPGAIGLPFRFPKGQREFLKMGMNNYYDENNSDVYIPFDCLSNDQEFFVYITCNANRKKIKQVDAGIRNLLMNIIEKSPVGTKKIYLFDAERQNTALLGPLNALSGSYAIEKVARTSEAISTSILEIVSSFTDTDDLLGDYDSVIDYNADHNEKEQIERKVIVLVGYPYAFSSDDKKQLSKMITNADRYGISIIAEGIIDDEKMENGKIKGLSTYALEEAITIQMKEDGTSIKKGKDSYKFSWYGLNDEINESYLEGIKALTVESNKVGNRYIHRYDISKMPTYERKYKKLSLPYGIDGKDQVHTIQFENENFATYLVGASRSGKSTLLHTLITGLIYNYHPDNVELWLADFKQLEFKSYIDNLPPHVKYVLLDESTELVYDLLDKLTDVMLKRQQLFGRLKVSRIDQVDPTVLKEPLPVIFVILDEFSIMSQAVAESDTYKLKLQNILAKGAALGIRFLFASQSFTTGIQGLTSTAKAQIQQRIAMKASKEEITATLELSGNMKTDQVNNWMESLPPHYALVKYRDDKNADSMPEVQRSYVLYFDKDKGDDDLRFNMINSLGSTMKKVTKYNPNDINTYVDKNPVLVDGNTYHAFDTNEFKSYLQHIDHSFYNGDETFISLGTPRLMSSIKPIALSQESRENILLVGDTSENTTVASIVSSVIKSYNCQNKKVVIWAYGKNRLYKTYENVWKNKPYQNVSFVVGADEICEQISTLKEKIKHGIESDEIIIMLGIDRITNDFDLGIEGAEGGNEVDEGIQAYKEQHDKEIKAYEKSGALMSDDENEKFAARVAQAWAIKERNLTQTYMGKGMSEAAMQEKLKADSDEFFDKCFTTHTIENETVKVYQQNESFLDEISKDVHKGMYNAKNDFTFIIKQGSRLGYHFMMVLNNYADLKSTFTKLDLYRHRIGFKMSKEQSLDLFGSRVASQLPDHVYEYSDTIDRYSFRPYINDGINFDGWFIDSFGRLNNPFEDNGVFETPVEEPITELNENTVEQEVKSEVTQEEPVLESQPVVEKTEDEIRDEVAKLWFAEKKKLREELKEKGLSKEEIKTELEKKHQEFLKEKGL